MLGTDAEKSNVCRKIELTTGGIYGLLSCHKCLGNKKSFRPGSRLLDPFQPLFNIVFLYAFKSSERLALAIWMTTPAIVSAANDEKRPTLQSVFEAAIRNSWHPVVDRVDCYRHKSKMELNYNYGLREAARVGDVWMMEAMIRGWEATDLHSAFNAAAHSNQVVSLKYLYTESKNLQERAKREGMWSFNKYSHIDCGQAIDLAASVGNIAAVEFLLTCDQPLSQHRRDVPADRALMCAARRGQKDLVAFLLQCEGITIHWSAADAAIEAGHGAVGDQIMKAWTKKHGGIIIDRSA